MRLGKALDGRPLLREAVLDGAVNAEQALRIADTMDILAKVEIEPTPVDLSTKVAPDVLADAAALKRQQASARAVRRLQLSPCAGGRVRLSGWLDTESAAHVSAALDPLSSSVLLCGTHHRLIHRGEWQVRMATDGLPEFLPPAHIDRQRRPRRNIYHRRP